MSRLRPLVLALLLLAPAARAQDALTDGVRMMTEAAQLFNAGERDEAVFRFYLGQLRVRAWVAANPDHDPAGPVTAADAVFATVGPPINGWAYEDLDRVVATIDRVLAHDEANPDPSLPPEAAADARAGLAEYRAYIVENADALRAERAAAGLPNR